MCVQDADGESLDLDLRARAVDRNGDAATRPIRLVVIVEAGCRWPLKNKMGRDKPCRERKGE